MAAKTDSPLSAHTDEEYAAYIIKQFNYDDPELKPAAVSQILDTLLRVENDSSELIIKEVKDRIETDPEFQKEISSGEWSTDTLRYIKDLIRKILVYRDIRIALDNEMKEAAEDQQLDAAINGPHDEIEENLKTAIDAANAKISTLQAEKIQLQADLAEALATIKGDPLSDRTKQLLEVKQIASLTYDVKKLTEEKSTLQADKEALIKTNADLIKCIDAMTAQRSEIMRQLLALKEKMIDEFTKRETKLAVIVELAESLSEATKKC
jgi:small-conductance mechanosensitive channel